MKSSKSSLFLMELIISILFFSLASAACIQLFVKAHVLDIRTREQNETVIWSQNLASLWQAKDGDLNAIYKQLVTDLSNPRDAFDLSLDKKTLTVMFNKDFELLSDVSHTSDMGSTDNGISNENAIYYKIILMDLGIDDIKLQEAKISFIRGDEIFYSLPLFLHNASERGPVNE